PCGGILFVKPDVSDFRLSIGAPGDGELREALAAEEQSVRDDGGGGEVRRMGELRLETDVARGEDASVGGSQSVVDEDSSLAVELHASRFQTDLLDVPRSPGADEDLVDGHRILAPADRELEGLAVVASLHVLDLDPEREPYAVALEHARQMAPRVRISAAENPRQHVEEDALGPEPMK